MNRIEWSAFRLLDDHEEHLFGEIGRMVERGEWSSMNRRYCALLDEIAEVQKDRARLFRDVYGYDE